MENKKPSLGQLRRAKPAYVSAALPEAVRHFPLFQDRPLPLVFQPEAPGANLAEWAASNRQLWEQKLCQHGALLFRGFSVNEAAEFERVINVMGGAALEYRERSSPRHAVSGNIYTSTDYPADQSIFPHNENSYAHLWPLKIFFHCALPSLTGGETPVTDVRRVYQRLTPQTRDKFARLGVLYVRNYSPLIGLSWQTVFQTEDRAEAEANCRAAGYEYEWLAGDRLRTRRIGQAVVRHPRTGESVWFNHGAFFHVSTLGAHLERALRAQFAEEDLPNNTYYGNGAQIEMETLGELRAAYLAEQIAFPWQRGDVLLLDNMLVAHARAPFTGPRKILVGMAEPFDSRNLTETAN